MVFFRDDVTGVTYKWYEMLDIDLKPVCAICAHSHAQAIAVCHSLGLTNCYFAVKY